MVEPRRRLIAAALALGAALMAGCESAESRPWQEQPLAGLTVRTDLEPLRDAFPELGQMVDAHWQQRVVGAESWVPGPSDILIQAVVVLRAEDLAAITGKYPWEQATAGWDERMTEQLRPFAPASGDWQRSVLFEADIQAPYYTGGGKVIVDLRSGTVYLNVSTS